MKTLNLFVLTCIFAAMLSSCKKDNEFYQEKPIVKEITWLNSLGISDLQYNYDIPFEMVEKLNIPRNDFYNYEISDEVFITENNEKGLFFHSCNDDNKSFFAKFDKNNNLISENLIIISEHTIEIFSIENELLEIISLDELRALPNCDELGPNQEGESWGECVVRNWANFGCDAVGVATQITMPKVVIAAIIVVCTVSNVVVN